MSGFRDNGLSRAQAHACPVVLKNACPYQKLFRRSHREATRQEAPLACPVVSQGTCCRLKNETFKGPAAYAARRL
jgi:hypothetical protein